LSYYTNDEIQQILRRSAEILGIEIGEGATKEIARRSRFTPRTANYLIKRCRDFAQVSEGSMDVPTVKEALTLLEIDETGLSKSDRDILAAIIEKFGGGPVGLKTLAAALSEEEATIEEVYEPYLMQMGLLERTPRGRVATARAYKHLGLESPRQQNKLV